MPKTPGPILVAVLALTIAPAVAFAATWQRESPDSWSWVDLDSVQQNGNLTYFAVAIGCNGSGGMPMTGPDGYVSPEQCMFGTPVTNAIDCATGDVYYGDAQNGPLQKSDRPVLWDNFYRIVCYAEPPQR